MRRTERWLAGAGLLAALVLVGVGAALAQGAGQPVTAMADPRGTLNLSGTITTGGTFQTAQVATGGRRSIEFVNICNIAGKCNATTDVCWVNMTAAATATTDNSIPVAAGSAYLRSISSIPNDAIRITCDVTGDKFYLSVQ